MGIWGKKSKPKPKKGEGSGSGKPKPKKNPDDLFDIIGPADLEGFDNGENLDDLLNAAQKMDFEADDGGDVGLDGLDEDADLLRELESLTKGDPGDPGELGGGAGEELLKEELGLLVESGGSKAGGGAGSGGGRKAPAAKERVAAEERESERERLSEKKKKREAEREREAAEEREAERERLSEREREAAEEREAERQRLAEKKKREAERQRLAEKKKREAEMERLAAAKKREAAERKRAVATKKTEPQPQRRPPARREEPQTQRKSGAKPYKLPVIKKTKARKSLEQKFLTMNKKDPVEYKRVVIELGKVSLFKPQYLKYKKQLIVLARDTFSMFDLSALIGYVQALDRAFAKNKKEFIEKEYILPMDKVLELIPSKLKFRKEVKIKKEDVDKWRRVYKDLMDKIKTEKIKISKTLSGDEQMIQMALMERIEENVIDMLRNKLVPPSYSVLKSTVRELVVNKEIPEDVIQIVVKNLRFESNTHQKLDFKVEMISFLEKAPIVSAESRFDSRKQTDKDTLLIKVDSKLRRGRSTTPRQFKRKEIVLNLHKKKMFGGRFYVIGSGKVSLASLLSKPSYETKVAFMDNNKMTGFTVVFSANIRTPLTTNDYTMVEIEKLSVDFRETYIESLPERAAPAEPAAPRSAPRKESSRPAARAAETRKAAQQPKRPAERKVAKPKNEEEELSQLLNEKAPSKPAAVKDGRIPIPRALKRARFRRRPNLEEIIQPGYQYHLDPENLEAHSALSLVLEHVKEALKEKDDPKLRLLQQNLEKKISELEALSQSGELTPNGYYILVHKALEQTKLDVEVYTIMKNPTNLQYAKERLQKLEEEEEMVIEAIESMAGDSSGEEEE